MMDKDFQERLRKADQAWHPVEEQWHHPRLTRFGYLPVTGGAQGLVRRYTYEHPETGHRIEACTGVSADYWTDSETGATGYWRDLEPHLAAREKKEQA